MQQKNSVKTPAKKKTKGIKPVKKPFLKGTLMNGHAVRQGFKLLAYELLFMFLNVLLGSALSFEGSAALRIASNLLLVAACAALVYMDGARVGEADVAFAEIAYARKESGKSVDDKDMDRCYNGARSFLTVLIGTLPLILLAAYFAFGSTLQVYALQALPGWTGAFAGQEAMRPLAYYDRTYVFTFMDFARPVIRAGIYPYVNMVGTGNAAAVLTVDRLSPLLVLLPFLFYGVGYIQGPRSRALVHGSIASDQKRRVRREKKERRARQNKPNQIV